MTNVTKSLKVRENLLLFNQRCLVAKNIMVLKLDGEKSRNDNFLVLVGYSTYLVLTSRTN